MPLRLSRSFQACSLGSLLNISLNSLITQHKMLNRLYVLGNILLKKRSIFRFILSYFIIDGLYSFPSLSAGI